MKVLLLENDTYLAQSISNKLNDRNHECLIVNNIKHVVGKNQFFDIIVASYDICENYSKILSKYKNTMMIMMVKYVNYSTVTKLIKSGVQDYIVKPFSVDELIHKIEHYREFNILKKEVVFYKNYFEFIENILNIPLPQLPNYNNPPFVIKSNNQRSADIYAMRYARLKKIQFNFLSLQKTNWKEILKNDSRVETLYLTGLEKLKKSDQMELLDNLIKQNVLLSFISQEEIDFKNVIDISKKENSFDLNVDMLSIKDYEKMIITRYESVYSDIELAKKLGISRKSLWEKRKRYNILKKNKRNNDK